MVMPLSGHAPKMCRASWKPIISEWSKAGHGNGIDVLSAEIYVCTTRNWLMRLERRSDSTYAYHVICNFLELFHDFVVGGVVDQSGHVPVSSGLVSQAFSQIDDEIVNSGATHPGFSRRPRAYASRSGPRDGESRSAFPRYSACPRDPHPGNLRANVVRSVSSGVAGLRATATHPDFGP